MKQWKEIPVLRNSAAQPSQLNVNLGKTLDEYNGGLNGLNMPVHAVTDAHMKPPDVGSISSGAVDKFNVSLPSQAYHFTKIDNRNVGGTDIWTPLLQLNLLTDNWSKGWNRLSDYSPFKEFSVEFDALEGSLVGCVTIDWGHGTDVIRKSEDGFTISVNAGYTWWTEWAVFVNDVIVSRSGQIPPRRHTTQLPFNVPIGSQQVDVRVKFMTNNSIEIALDNSHGTELDVFSATCWVRNVYR